MERQRCVVLTADIRWMRAEFLQLLDAVERARVRSFVHDDDRSRVALGAVVTRLALAAQLGCEPEDLQIDRACPRCGRPHGKPVAPESGLHFSVSHSATMVLVALSSDGPVGVDVEHRDRRFPGGMAGFTLAEPERVSAADDLLTYWCRKESVMKATGDGLRVGPRNVIVSAPDASPRLIRYCSSALRATMSDLDLGVDFVGAVTVLTEADLQFTLRSAEAMVEEWIATPRGVLGRP